MAGVKRKLLTAVAVALVLVTARQLNVADKGPPLWLIPLVLLATPPSALVWLPSPKVTKVVYVLPKD